jgi:hypothetical protein
MRAYFTKGQVYITYIYLTIANFHLHMSYNVPSLIVPSWIWKKYATYKRHHRNMECHLQTHLSPADWKRVSNRKGQVRPRAFQMWCVTVTTRRRRKPGKSSPSPSQSPYPFKLHIVIDNMEQANKYRREVNSWYRKQEADRPGDGAFRRRNNRHRYFIEELTILLEFLHEEKRRTEGRVVIDKCYVTG